MNKVFVFGSINLDLNFVINKFPEAGETIKSQDFFISSGGKGANQAVACAKQNTETIMLGSVGTDSFSDLCLKSLMKYSVNVDFINRAEERTCGLAGIIIHNQDNRIITYAGANIYQEVDKIKKVLEENSNTNDFLISQLEIPTEIITEVFTFAKDKCLITVLNAAPAQVLPDKLLSQIDILVVNESEFKITVNDNFDSQSLTSKLESLFDKGIKSVLLTLGDKGSRYYSPKTTINQKAYLVEPIDTTAAGDTFIGAFVSQILIGNPIETAMDYASAAASLTTLKFGAQDAIPYKEEVISFIRKST